MSSDNPPQGGSEETLMTLQQAVDVALTLKLTDRRYNPESLADSARRRERGDADELYAPKFGHTRLVTLRELKRWLADPKRGKPGPKPQDEE